MDVRHHYMTFIKVCLFYDEIMFSISMDSFLHARNVLEASISAEEFVIVSDTIQRKYEQLERRFGNDAGAICRSYRAIRHAD